MELSLTGQRVLVTAGATGIGRAICETFLAAGAKVHTCDIEEGALAQTAAALPGLGTSIADVAAEGDVERLFEEAEQTLGNGLDVLVNNAGVAGPTLPVEEIPSEEFQHTLAVNVDGQFFCLKRAVPLLKAAGGGAVIGLSSAAGLRGFPLRTPYVAAKWAVVGMTKSLAMELGEHKIRVNCLCPGAVAGDRIDRVIAAKAEQRGITFEEMSDVLLKDVSLHCFVSAQDIANMALYLASPLGATITGQAISVDGNVEVLK